MLRDVLCKYCGKVVGDGLNTRLWEDLWVGEAPFNIKFARLYNLTFRLVFG
jgi:hypothetical protein